MLLIGLIVVGLFLYADYSGKQDAIRAQDRQEYIGKRRMECYAILERERSMEKEQHNSVVDAKYYEPSSNPFDGKDFNDACRVEYKYLITNADGKTEVVTDFKSY